eukprot:833219-Pleurochrysis_carterae.AAC.1
MPEWGAQCVAYFLHTHSVISRRAVRHLCSTVSSCRAWRHGASRRCTPRPGSRAPPCRPCRQSSQ